MNALLIGMGMVAQTHLLALRDNGAGVQLGGVVGRDPARTRAFADQAADLLGYPVDTHTDIDAGIATKPDVAILITPPNARVEYAQVLSAAAIPTLMEKPVERTLEQARDVVGLYHNLPLGIVFQHRTRAASRTLKKRLESKDLGEIIHIEIRVPWWRDQAYYDEPGRGSYARDGGGVMISQAIHTLDLALWLCGPVEELQARMRTSPLHRLEAEDIATALLTFETGATGLISATTCAYPGGAESIALITTKARALLEGDALRIDWIDGETEVLGTDQSTGGGADPMAFTHGWHQSILEDFAQAIRVGCAPLATGQEALQVHAAIDAMTRASASGRTEKVCA